jgi:thioesterase domain-containing protein/acyl carrier protein
VDKKALLMYVCPEDDISFYIAPRTNVEMMLADIWSEYLNLKKVGIYDNFFELGGHSLIAVKVMTKIERLTGKRLPLASLLEKPTIERQARLLDLDGRSVTWDSLVPIKPQGAKMPLYIVHGAGLNVLLFNAVAMGLAPDQPVYGLQAKGLDGIEEPLKTIEEMAAFYVGAVTRHNPNGPYALSGFSFGGIIAWEMARQLKAEGREVKLLALFDTNAYQTISSYPFAKKIQSQLAYYVNNIIHTLKFTTGFRNTMREKTKHLKRKLIRRYWSIFYSKDQNQQGFFGYAHKIDKYNIDALKNYQLKAQDIELDVFKAETRTYYVSDKKFLGWRPLALQGVNVHHIPGEHNTIFKAPNDRPFAEALQKCLDRVNAAPPPGSAS